MERDHQLAGDSRRAEGDVAVSDRKRWPRMSLLLAGLALPAIGRDAATVTFTSLEQPAPATTAHVTQVFLDAPAAGHVTGTLHLRYSDGTDIRQALPPKAALDGNQSNDEGVGFGDPKIADDRRAIGWTELWQESAPTDPIPLVLSVYRSESRVVHIAQGQMIWFWTFLGRGGRLAAVWGPTHGPEVGDYQLYDPASGKLLDEAFADPVTQGLRPDAPDWAKDVERQWLLAREPGASRVGSPR